MGNLYNVLCTMKRQTSGSQFGCQNKKDLGTKPKLIPDGRGIFDVVVEDELVYSKFKTGSFPDEKQLMNKLVSAQHIVQFWGPPPFG